MLCVTITKGENGLVTLPLGTNRLLLLQRLGGREGESNPLALGFEGIEI